MIRQQMNYAIEVGELEVVRGRQVVISGLNLQVAAGSLVGLVGPSGSGKTTLMRIIVGVQTVAHGWVRVLGLPAGDRRVRPLVGYVTQAPAVYTDLTVRENLRYFGSVVGVGRKRVEATISEVALEAKADAKVGRLSGGEVARVSLAAALLAEPPVLILDEPTVGLDPVLREELWSLFRRLASGGTTLVVSSHVMEEAGRCQRLLLLRAGALLADSSPAELLRRTQQADLDGAFLRLLGHSPP